MSTLLYRSGMPVSLALLLEDGASGLYPQALVFDGGAILDTIDLGSVGLGRYSGTWIPGAASSYDVLFIVYEDSGHAAESPIYTREMERWQNASIFYEAISRGSLPADTADQVWDEVLAAHTLAGSSGEFLGRLTAVRASNIDDSNVRVRLLEKIARNRLELADGSVNNWILYDDDDVTPLLTWSVSDKDGSGIVQHRLVPSRRTRGQ